MPSAGYAPSTLTHPATHYSTLPSLTPARILGIEKDVGSIEVGKRADLVVMDAELNVRQVYVGGERIV